MKWLLILVVMTASGKVELYAAQVPTLASCEEASPILLDQAKKRAGYKSAVAFCTDQLRLVPAGSVVTELDPLAT